MSQPHSLKASSEARTEANSNADNEQTHPDDPNGGSRVEETLDAQPAWYFFYGTLIEPTFLQMIAKLEEAPVMFVREAKITYWTIFKAMVPGEGVVHGVTCYIPSAEAVEHLRTFEGHAYDDVWIDIELEDGTIRRGRTFMSSLDEAALRKSPMEGEILL